MKEMKMTFRHYGDGDPISLEYISQIPGMSGIVSAVYLNGIWEAINKENK